MSQGLKPCPNCGDEHPEICSGDEVLCEICGLVLFFDDWQAPREDEIDGLTDEQVSQELARQGIDVSRALEKVRAAVAEAKARQATSEPDAKEAGK